MSKLQNPLISIIIPCFNEEKYIQSCLKSLSKQDIGENFEILIVDGMSTDNTYKKIIEFKNNNKFEIKILKNKKRRTPYALNIGVKNSKGKYIVIIGAHSKIPTNWLKLNYQTMLKSDLNVMCVGGKIENKILNNTLYSESSKFVLNSFWGTGVNEFRYSNKSSFVITVPFGFYKKEIFDKIGFFDTNFLVGQDYEFNLRIILNGFKVFFEPKIKCSYYVREKPKKLIKQMINYGTSKIKIFKKHKKIGKFEFIPLIFSVYIILLPILFFIHKIFLLPIILYIILTSYFSYKKKNLFFYNLVNYFIIHFFYGLGMIKALLKYFNK